MRTLPICRSCIELDHTELCSNFTYWWHGEKANSYNYYGNYWREYKKKTAKQGITQDDLAKKRGIKYSTLAKIECDFVTKPGVQMLIDLPERHRGLPRLWLNICFHLWAPLG
jgi:hypothetical protein